jgi:hypothetical protein
VIITFQFNKKMFISILVVLVLELQCVFSVPPVKEEMFSLAASNVKNIWDSFKLKHSRSFKNQSEETKRYKFLFFY